MTHSEPPSPSWAAAEAVLSAEPTAVRCISYLEQLFREEMQRPRPDIAKLSIALVSRQLAESSSGPVRAGLRRRHILAPRPPSHRRLPCVLRRRVPWRRR